MIPEDAKNSAFDLRTVRFDYDVPNIGQPVFRLRNEKLLFGTFHIELQNIHSAFRTTFQETLKSNRRDFDGSFVGNARSGLLAPEETRFLTQSAGVGKRRNAISVRLKKFLRKAAADRVRFERHNARNLVCAKEIGRRAADVGARIDNVVRCLFQNQLTAFVPNDVAYEGMDIIGPGPELDRVKQLVELDRHRDGTDSPSQAHASQLVGSPKWSRPLPDHQEELVGRAGCCSVDQTIVAEDAAHDARNMFDGHNNSHACNVS